MNKLYVIGTGPGEFEKMTMEAVSALNESEYIVGYGVYTAFLKPHFPNKEYYETPMTKERERVINAIEAAASGRTTAIVSGGDSGVYGMAGLVFTTLGDRCDVEVKVIAGVTAALSGAASLGAPLTHDFAVISLSDLLTPWDVIKKRLKAAAMGDFSIVIYNPSSKNRSLYLKYACEILLEHKAYNTPCAMAKNIGRQGENLTLLTLDELKDTKADMFTTVFVGNSQTKIINGKMVTPRGYDHE